MTKSKKSVPAAWFCVHEKIGLRVREVAAAFAVHPNIDPAPRDCAIYVE